jgi:predicted phage terminase large subunit-like protein
MSLTNVDLQWRHYSPRLIRHTLITADSAIQEQWKPAAKHHDHLDLLSWSRYFFPDHFLLPPSAMHLWLAAQLDRISIPHSPLPIPHSELHLNLLAPRASAKSTVATFAFVTREALTGRHEYIWIVSDTRHQACAHLENIKTELLENRLLTEEYPDATGQGPVWRSGAIILKNGVMIEAFGTGQRIRGRRRRRHRPTLIICDDLENDGHISSPLARDKSRNWFHGMLMKAGTPRTLIINLGTALHRQCLAWQLHHNPGWTSRLFRAIERFPDRMELWAQWEEMYQANAEFGVRSAESIAAIPHSEFRTPHSPDLEPARSFYLANRSEMDQGVAVLWPEQEDLYTLMCMRAESGHSSFDREKQSTPVNPDLCEWPEEYFADHIWFDEWPKTSAELGMRSAEYRQIIPHSELRTPHLSLIPHSPFPIPHLSFTVLALDPSKGADSRRGDYSVFVLLGVGSDNSLYVEADLARRPTPQIVEGAVELARRFQPQALGIEANQFQELLGADISAALISNGLIGTVACSITNTVNKQVRIRRLGPLLAARRLRFKTNSPGTRLLVEQLREFPIADHDDGPDALEMALRLAESFMQPAHNDGLGDRLI